MNNKLDDKTSLVFSYLEIRKTIGILGIALPFVLSLGALIFFQTGFQSSISSYYYTGMRNVFVGILCAIGFFLLSYRDYERNDKIAGDLGCIFALGVAFFPMKPDVVSANYNPMTGYAHFFFAAGFFITLTYFSLYLFTKTEAKKTPTKRKILRNKVYKACGYMIAICILLIAIYSILPENMASIFKSYKPVYWLEALAILAFGVSWFTKGEAILKDAV